MCYRPDQIPAEAGIYDPFMKKATGYPLFLSLILLLLVLSTSCERERATPIAASRPPASGPLTVHPENPRYFMDATGRAVYLTGSHTWMNLSDIDTRNPPRRFDFTAYLDKLAMYNHNFIRLWRWEMPEYAYANRPATRYSDPHPWVRTGPGTAPDGGLKFDLDTFDDAYFRRLRERVVAAGQRGIYVCVMLFEGHALANAETGWHSHPFHADNNINAVDGDLDGDGRGVEIQTLQSDQLLARQKAYVRHVIDAVNDLDNVMYEIANEAHISTHDFQIHMIDFVREYESTLPKQHLVFYTAPYGKYGEEMWESNADVIAPGKLRHDGQVLNQTDPPAGDGRKIIMLDTDHLWGCGGNASWVWRTFCRGLHPIYMDSWTKDNPHCHDPDPAIREAMGQTLRIADGLDLVRMTPRDDLASSRFCLADPGRSYVIYLPDGGAVDVDLSAVTGTFDVAWFRPHSAETYDAGPIEGGSIVTMSAPFPRDAVLLLRQEG